MTLNEQIQNISKSDFEKLIKFGKRWNPLLDEIKGIKTKEGLIYYSYEFVKINLPSYLSDGKAKELLIDVFDIKSFKGLTIQRVMPLILWFYDELKKVSELEQNYLSTPPSNDMLRAGVESLNELGEEATIDMLVKDWGVYTHKQIKSMPYYEIFNKLRLMKLQGDIQSKLADIQKEKAKQKR